MEKDQGHEDFIDSITGFAMRQASRRGFIKWVAKGGVALAAGMTAGFEWFTGTALASINCSQYLPGCFGECTCEVSTCTDPDGGGTQTCVGVCPSPCGPPYAAYYEAHIFWVWNGSRCVALKSCVGC